MGNCDIPLYFAESSQDCIAGNQAYKKASFPEFSLTSQIFMGNDVITSVTEVPEYITGKKISLLLLEYSVHKQY